MKQKILILGVGGMVGHKLFFELSKDSKLEVYATTRVIGELKSIFDDNLLKNILPQVDARQIQTILSAIAHIKPDVVVNCIGITKQLTNEERPKPTIELNALFPHLLAEITTNSGARMLQMATDCVFSGIKGNYTESDKADAIDLYGRTKYLGEVHYPNCLTLRTSFIGHEIKSQKHGLVEWFLSQKKEIGGFRKAIYSGLPTVEIARIIREFVLPNPKLSGLYQVSSTPINKYDLLKLIAKAYHKEIKIIPEDNFICDRSLNSNRFKKATGFTPLSWEEMVDKMYKDYISFEEYRSKLEKG